MQVIKFIILMLIFLLSSFIGILISKKYSSRVMELKEVKKLLNMLKSKIKFTYEPLPDILKQISKNTIKNLSEMFLKASVEMKTKDARSAWNIAVETANLNLNNEDINVLKDLGKMIRKNRYRRTS